ncbi:MAG: prephenate dehydrogenase/arogenate dehydrogenase family protein [Candidatus Omnitrophica bacterium]|nr:prephenate dehydrogenase/arogenate dehydrogenase family protein [Candidatus Omnitrophota bacterium]
MTRKFRKIVVIGTGLIGGSICKALMKKQLVEEVVGVCRRESSLERALKERAITRGFVNSYPEALKGAEAVFIATPVHTIKDVFESLADTVDSSDVIVSDVGSTKREIVLAAGKFSDRFSFVGAHPLAGSEKTGVEHSCAELFEDSVCVLTPERSTSADARGKIKMLWQEMGATVVELSPGEHDEYLAYTSHLPHAAAFALVNALEEKIPQQMVSSGFRDTTRIAASDPALWSDIFMTNRDNVLGSIKRYKKMLESIEKALRENDRGQLERLLEEARRKRDEIVQE